MKRRGCETGSETKNELARTQKRERKVRRERENKIVMRDCNMPTRSVKTRKGKEGM